MPELLDAPWYTLHGDDLTVRIRVQPRAARCSIAIHTDGRLKLRLTAAPADGKANQQALEILAKIFDVSRSRVALRAGAASRDKTFVVRVAEVDQKRLPDPLALPASLTGL